MENNSAKIKNTAIIVFLVFLMFFITYVWFFGPGKKLSESLTPSRTITISAEGKITVEPDIAKISFSVVSEGVNPKTLAEDNNKKMNSAVSFIKSQGVDEKDIKTVEYNLSPRYEYDEKTKKTSISGYSLTQSVLVKVRELGKTAEILGGLPELGINQIGSISFDIDEPEKYLTEARDQAFNKAKTKAGEMAAKNNVRLGKVINFSDYQSGPIPYYYDSFGKGGQMETLSSAPSIQPGSREVTVNVSVTYEIK